MKDTPQIVQACNTATNYSIGDTETWVGNSTIGLRAKPSDDQVGAIMGRFLNTEKERDVEMNEDTKRLVQVFIVDPEDKMPLKDSLLYSGDQFLTDLSDQELFFEIEIKSLLDKHNERRKKTLDKAKKSSKKFYLESIRIRDLSMTVVTIASF